MRKLKDLTLTLTTLLLCSMFMCIAACSSDNGDGNGEGTGKGDGILKGHKYVDLGLPSGVKWATCNIGASSPEKKGSFFMWGDTGKEKDKDKACHREYDEDGGYYKFTKYTLKDEKTILDAEDDAAIVNWGGGWRMPTAAEITEICENCQWSQVTVNGEKVYKAIGKNGNSILFPDCGCWSNTRTKVQGGAYILGNNVNCEDGVRMRLCSQNREAGRCIRPVFK